MVLRTALAAALLWMASTSVLAAADPRAGVIALAGKHNGFIYDAAMSRRFGSIETHAVLEKDGRERLFMRRWERIDDFDACAAAIEARRAGESQAFEAETWIMDLALIQEDLIAGSCVIGRLVRRSTARQVLVTDDDGVQVWPRRGARPLAKSDDPHLDPMLLFGLPSNRHAGGAATPDALSDAAIIRALQAGPEMRDNAVWALASRVEVDHRPLAFLVLEKRPTSRAVAEALVASGALRDPEVFRRQRALWAAGSMPEAADLLLPQVLEALELPAETQEEMESRQSNPERYRLRGRQPKPGREYSAIADAAAWASSRLGAEAATQVWAVVEQKALQDLQLKGPTRGYILAAIAAGEAESLATTLLRSPKVHGLESGGVLVATAGPGSAKMRELVEYRCSFQPSDQRPLPAMFCDVMAHRYGDPFALERLTILASLPADSGKPWSADLRHRAAEALLLHTGEEGRAALLRLAGAADLRTGEAAMSAACSLGPLAGAEVRAHVAALAAREEALRDELELCDLPTPVYGGAFAAYALAQDAASR